MAVRFCLGPLVFKILSIMKQKSFTVIELLIVLAMITLITAFILVSLKSVRGKARDARRFRDIDQIHKALQFLWIDNEEYPEKTCPCGDKKYKEWETSDKEPAEFMEYLLPYLSEIPVDPINKKVKGSGFFGSPAGDYFYAYQDFTSADYCLCDKSSPTCKRIDRPFVIIAISNLEAYVPPDLPEKGMPLPDSIKVPRATCGDPGSDDICTEKEYKKKKCRDWSQEFDYSLMLIE